MNLFVLYSATNEITSRWLFTHFEQSMLRKFSDVKFCNIKKEKELFILKFLSQCEEKDVLFADLRDHHLSVDVIRKIQSMNCFKINYLVDCDLTWRLSSSVCYDIFDFTLVAFQRLAEKLQSKYPKVKYFPYGCFIDDKIETSMDRSKRITFLGSPTKVRLKYLQYLNTLKVPYISNLIVSKQEIFRIRPSLSIIILRFLMLYVRINNILAKLFISNVAYERKILTDEEYKKTYTDYWYSLSVLEHQNTGLLLPSYIHIRMRDYEALASGSILISRENPDISYIKSKGIVIHTYSDSTSFENAIQSALATDNPEEVSLRNLRLMREHFDWADRLLTLKNLGNRSK